jgi:hypothetical protein
MKYKLQIFSSIFLIVFLINWVTYSYIQASNKNKLLDINYCISETQKIFPVKSKEEVKDLCIEGLIEYYTNK